MDWLTTYRPYFETAYFIASIGLLSQVIMVKKDMKDRNRRAAVEQSLQYLDRFATRIIPAINDYNRKFKAEVANPQNTSRFYEEGFNYPMTNLGKEILAEMVVKQKCGIMQILNELEAFSVAVMERVVIDEVLFTPLGKTLCKWMIEEHLVIAINRNIGVPYKNLIDLYSKWNSRIEVNNLKLQKLDAERKIKQKGNKHKSNPPIGS